MKNMDEAVTKGFLKEVLAESFALFEERLMSGLEGKFIGIDKQFKLIDQRFESIEGRLGNLEARVELGFSELNERLDAEQQFTSDMWDDFSARLMALELK